MTCPLCGRDAGRDAEDLWAHLLRHPFLSAVTRERLWREAAGVPLPGDLVK